MFKATSVSILLLCLYIKAHVILSLSNELIKSLELRLQCTLCFLLLLRGGQIGATRLQTQEEYTCGLVAILAL